MATKYETLDPSDLFFSFITENLPDKTLLVDARISSEYAVKYHPPDKEGNYPKVLRLTFDVTRGEEALAQVRKWHRHEWRKDRPEIKGIVAELKCPCRYCTKY